MFRKIARNVLWNWLGLFVHMLVPLILTPFVLNTLGEARYGVWILSLSIIGYYGLLDVGFGAGATQYITRYLATESYDKMNRTASSIVFALSLVGALILVVSLVVGFSIPRILDLPPGLEHEVFWVIVILGSSTAIQFALFPFSAVFVATQRYDLSNVISVTTRLLSALAIFLTLSSGHGLIGLSIVMAVTNFVDYALRWRISYRLVPQLKVSVKLANWKSAKEVLSYGIWNSMNSVTVAIESYTDVLIIAAFLPVSAIAPFALAMRVAQYLQEGINSGLRVVFPAATHMHAQEDYTGMRRVYLEGSRVALALGACLAAIGSVWAEDFYHLWVGNTYEGTDTLGLIATLFYIQAVAVVLTVMPGTSGQILMAAKRVKAVAMISFGEALLNVVLSLFLIQSYGLIGVAMGTLIARLLVRTWAFPAVVSGLLSIPLSTFIRKAWPRPLAAGVLMVIIGLAIRGFHAPAGWLQLVIVGVAASVIACLLIFGIGMTREERQKAIDWFRDYAQRRSKSRSEASAQPGE